MMSLTHLIPVCKVWGYSQQQSQAVCWAPQLLFYLFIFSCTLLFSARNISSGWVNIFSVKSSKPHCFISGNKCIPVLSLWFVSPIPYSEVKENNPLVIWRAFACFPLECIAPYFGNKKLCLWVRVILLQSQSARRRFGAHLLEPVEVSEDPECSRNPMRKPDGDDASSELLTWPVYTCHFLCLLRLMIRTSVYAHARTLQCSSMQCTTNQPAFKAVFREYNLEGPSCEAWTIAHLL